MKKITYISALILTTFILLACPTNDDDRIDPDKTLIIINKSGIDIVDVTLSSNAENDLPLGSPFRNQELINASTIKANEERSFPLRSSTVRDNGLKFALLSREVIETESWETIREKNLVLKVFNLTLKDLEALNYELVYP